MNRKDSNMNSQPIMEFHIIIRPEDISLHAENGSVKIIPFTGFTESELFTGTIMPGAADVQNTDPAGVRHLCAKYMFSGKDMNGKSCRLYVENTGVITGAEKDILFSACPSFISDSHELNERLSGSYFRSEGHSAPGGVLIRIYDVRNEETVQKEERPAEKPADLQALHDMKDALEKLDEEVREKAGEAADKIKAKGEIDHVILFSQKDGKVLKYRHDDLGKDDLCSLCGTLPDSPNILFVFLQDMQMICLFAMGRKILNIPHDTLPIFLQALEKHGDAGVFERPLAAYKQIKI